MKCKMFFGATGEIEKEINQWLSENPYIGILNTLQSGDCNITVTIFYDLYKKNSH